MVLDEFREQGLDNLRVNWHGLLRSIELIDYIHRQIIVFIRICGKSGFCRTNHQTNRSLPLLHTGQH